MLPTFPYSPLPAALDRTVNWGENVVTYDNGTSQGDTAFVKPLFQWAVPIELMTEIHQQSLAYFVNQTKGMTRPFLIKDAYEYLVGSVVLADSGQFTNGSTTFLYDVNSYMVRPDTHYVGSLFSALSGYVTLGNEYTVEQDTGIIKINSYADGDVWSTNSPTQYFRKARLGQPYKDTAKMWNIFTADLTIVELP